MPAVLSSSDLTCTIQRCSLATPTFSNGGPKKYTQLYQHVASLQCLVHCLQALPHNDMLYHKTCLSSTVNGSASAAHLAQHGKHQLAHAYRSTAAHLLIVSHSFLKVLKSLMGCGSPHVGSCILRVQLCRYLCILQGRLCVAQLQVRCSPTANKSITVEPLML